jgi:hypothetical protein
MHDGDDATFTLQGLRLARVNDDLAGNLGQGSERGFSFSTPAAGGTAFVPATSCSRSMADRFATATRRASSLGPG